MSQAKSLSRSKTTTSAGKRSQKASPGSSGPSGSSGTLMGRGVEASPDVVYKMCKKIAQLTKVIYYLNTKNEDHGVEIDSLADAYENEIDMVITDGKAMISELKIRAEDAELKLKAHEEVIQSQMESVTEYQNEIKMLKDTDNRLRQLISKIEGEKQDLEKKHQQEMDDARSAIKNFSQSDEEVSSIRKKYDDMIQQMQEQHYKELQEVSDTLKKQLSSNNQEIVTDYQKKIKQLTEDKQKVEEAMKETVNGMKKRYDEEMKFYQQESKKLKQLMDEQQKEAKEKLADMEKAMGLDLEMERSRVRDRDEAIKDYKEELRKKKDEVRVLEATTSDLKNQKQALEVQLKDLNSKHEALKKDLQQAQFRIEQGEIKISKLEDTLLSNKIKIESLESNLSKLQSDHKFVKGELYEREKELASANEQVKELTDDSNLMKRINMELENGLKDRDSMIRDLGDQMKALRKSHEEELSSSLIKQKTDLTDQHERLLKRTVNELLDKHEKEIDAKNESIKSLEEIVKDLEDEMKKRLQQAREEMDEQKRQYELQISDLMLVKGELMRKLDEANTTIEEKLKEIKGCEDEIDALNKANQALEVDKADLYQKMLHIDGQVRAEMTERFEHETAERTSEWEAQKAQELVLLKDRLTQEHETILQNTVFKMDAQRVEETDALKWDLSMAKEEWANKELEFDKQLAQLGTEKQMLYKELVDQRDNNIKRVAAIMDEHQQQLIDEKKAWDLEAQARETQLKVGHTLALSAVEKKYKVELEEVDKNNQKKIEEIKHANTAAAMTAKREAENQKQAELTKQRATHNAELDRMRDQHERDQMALRTSMEEQKTSEIADIRNKNSAAMEKKNAYIEQLTLEIANHQLEIKDLKQTIMELRYDIKQVEEQLAEKDRELQAAIADGKQRLKDLEAHMLAEKKDEIMKVNEEHVDEVKHMIREFEQAQNFLKKQIAQQAKQLQEADLRYINREPREVDLRHIAELEEEIKRRKKKISGLHDELDYYKLEMNNREASFNKIFNKTPLVGVMQPPTATPKGAKKTPGDKSDPRKERLPPLYLLSTTPPAGQAT